MFFLLPIILSFLSSFALSQNVEAMPDDPFYDEPQDLGKYQSGEIIRRRTISQTFYLNASIAEIAQVVYKTRLTEGGDSYSVATIFKPSNPDPNTKLYSYQLFEDAVQLDCAPSWTYKTGLFSPGVSMVINNLTGSIGPQIAQGRYVVVPDHEGAVSAFFGGRQEGYAGLDGIRAALNEIQKGDDVPVVLYGYSGGAHATAWMVNMHEEYAPSLNIIGAAYGGTLLDALGNFESVDIVEDPVKGSVAALLTGLLVAYPSVNSTLWPHISSYLKAIMIQQRVSPGLCNTGVTMTNYNNTVASNIDVDLATFPDTLRMFKSETLLTNFSSTPISTPSFPRYIYHGTKDSIAPFDFVESYVDQQESEGASIKFVTYPGMDHIQTAFVGLGPALAWVDGIFKSHH